MRLNSVNPMICAFQFSHSKMEREIGEQCRFPLCLTFSVNPTSGYESQVIVPEPSFFSLPKSQEPWRCSQCLQEG